MKQKVVAEREAIHAKLRSLAKAAPAPAIDLTSDDDDDESLPASPAPAPAPECDYLRKRLRQVENADAMADLIDAATWVLRHAPAELKVAFEKTGHAASFEKFERACDELDPLSVEFSKIEELLDADGLPMFR